MTAPRDPLLDLDVLDEAARQECLTAYLDGELSAEDARVVTAWLDEHPDVLRDIEHQRRVFDLLESYVDEPVADHFADGVFEAVGIRRGAVVQMAWYRRPLVAAAAGMLIALGGATAFWNLTERGRVPEPAETTPASLVALESVPAELLLDDDALTLVSSLSDDHFNAYVNGEYDAEEDAG